MSYNVLQGVERWLDVILTSQVDGITPITDTVYSDVAVRYRKEGAVASVSKTLASGTTDWINQDAGVYRVRFTGTELNTLGSFTYSVTDVSTDFMPYYGHIDVVSGDVTTITTNLTTVGNNILGVSGRVETAITDILAVDGHLTTVGNDVTTVNNNVLGVSGEVLVVAGDILIVDGKVTALQTSVSGLDDFMIGAGAYYDADAGSLTASLVLHKNGTVISNPISATIVGYSEIGVQLFTDMSSTPDAQGVFRFVETVTLTSKTVPYLKGTIVDANGTHRTITLTPVVA